MSRKSITLLLADAYLKWSAIVLIMMMHHREHTLLLNKKRVNKEMKGTN